MNGLIKNVSTLSYKYFLRFCTFSLLCALTACDACQTPEDIERELNNGNTDPATLILETWGTEVSQAFTTSIGGFGFMCTGSEFYANVVVEVRTASLVNNQLVVDNTAYYSATFEEVRFLPNNLLSDNDNTTIEISVPSTGAYQLSIIFELSNCSSCCHGIDDRQCGNTVVGNKCQAGIARVGYEELFPSSSRPPRQYNYAITTPKMIPLACICNSCLVDC